MDFLEFPDIVSEVKGAMVRNFCCFENLHN